MDTEGTEKPSAGGSKMGTVPLHDDSGFIEDVLVKLRAKMPNALDAPFFDDGIDFAGVTSKLSLWNAVLNPVGIELCEFEPGKLALSSFGAYRDVTGTDGLVQEAAVAFYWALKTFRCIKKVKFTHPMFLLHCFPFVKQAFLENDSVDVLKLHYPDEGAYSSAEFIDAFLKITQLRRIDLSGLELDTSGFENLSRLLEQNRQLEIASLQYKPLRGDVPPFLRTALQCLPCLKRLSWRSNGLVPVEVDGIAQLLLTTETLEKLEILYSEEDVNITTLQPLAQSLGQNHTLRALTFYYVFLCDAGAELIANALKENVHVKFLKLEHCDIGDVGGREIAKMLVLNETLEEVNLSNNLMANGAGKQFAEALSVNRVLKKLSLAANHIGTSAAILIARAVASNDIIEELDIGAICTDDFATGALELALGDGQPEVCDDEDEQLAKVFAELNSFERITASWGDAGIFELARALRSSSAIKKVSLEGICEISVEPEKELFEALLRNSTVEELELPIDLPCYNEATAVLAKYIKTTASLKRLSLSVEFNQKEAIAVLADALAQNRSIHHLEIVCAYVDEYFEKCLAEVLRQSATIETLVLNDFAGQFELTEHEPLVPLSSGLKENYALMKFKNEFSWMPWTGISEVHKVVRRNRVMLNVAARLVLGQIEDISSVPREAVNMLGLQKLCELIQKLAKLPAETARQKIEAAKLQVESCQA